VAQRPVDDLHRRKCRRRIAHHPDCRGVGKFPARCPHDAAAAKRPPEVVGPRVHDRAITDVDAVMHVGDGRTSQPPFNRQAIAECHSRLRGQGPKSVYAGSSATVRPARV